jgi:hypothetical protein
MKPHNNNFNQFLAAALIKGTRRHFSRLHADYLETENTMSFERATEKMQSGLPYKEDAGNTMTVGSQVDLGPIKPVDRKTLEGSTPGDFRAQADDVTMPAQPGPRGETGQSGC